MFEHNVSEFVQHKKTKNHDEELICVLDVRIVRLAVRSWKIGFPLKSNFLLFSCMRPPKELPSKRSFWHVLQFDQSPWLRFFNDFNYGGESVTIRPEPLQHG